MKKPIKYDIAISFAEENRDAALAMALALKAKGFKNVYYYPDRPDWTLGRPLKDALTSIYSAESRFVIILLSDSYSRKEHTQVELEAVRARMKNDPDEVFVIPVLIGENVIEQYPDLKSIGYIQWNHKPQKIAGYLQEIFSAENIGQLKDMAGKKWTKTIIHHYNFTKKVINNF